MILYIEFMNCLLRLVYDNIKTKNYNDCILLQQSNSNVIYVRIEVWANGCHS